MSEILYRKVVVDGRDTFEPVLPRCSRCGRPLKDPVSVARGMGDGCWFLENGGGTVEKYQVEVDGKDLGIHKKSKKLATLKKMKGVVLTPVFETPEQRRERLARMRENRKLAKAEKLALADQQPSLTSGQPTVEAYFQK